MSRTEAITCTANHHLHGSGEKNGAQWRIKVSFGKTMMQALELRQLVKGMPRDKATLNREEIEPVVMAIINCLKASVSKSISQ